MWAMFPVNKQGAQIVFLTLNYAYTNIIFTFGY